MAQGTEHSVIRPIYANEVMQEGGEVRMPREKGVWGKESEEDRGLEAAIQEGSGGAREDSPSLPKLVHLLRGGEREAFPLLQTSQGGWIAGSAHGLLFYEYSRKCTGDHSGG